MSGECDICGTLGCVESRHDSWVPVDYFRTRIRLCKCDSSTYCKPCAAHRALLSCYAIAVAVAAQYEGTDAPLGKMARAAIDRAEGR